MEAEAEELAAVPLACDSSWKSDRGTRKVGESLADRLLMPVPVPSSEGERPNRADIVTEWIGELTEKSTPVPSPPIPPNIVEPDGPAESDTGVTGSVSIDVYCPVAVAEVVAVSGNTLITGEGTVIGAGELRTGVGAACGS